MGRSIVLSGGTISFPSACLWIFQTACPRICWFWEKSKKWNICTARENMKFNPKIQSSLHGRSFPVLKNNSNECFMSRPIHNKTTAGHRRPSTSQPRWLSTCCLGHQLNPWTQCRPENGRCSHLSSLRNMETSFVTEMERWHRRWRVQRAEWKADGTLRSQASSHIDRTKANHSLPIAGSWSFKKQFIYKRFLPLFLVLFYLGGIHILIIITMIVITIHIIIIRKTLNKLPLIPHDKELGCVHWRHFEALNRGPTLNGRSGPKWGWHRELTDLLALVTASTSTTKLRRKKKKCCNWIGHQIDRL